ncbi:MAG: hypothetical protein E6Q92_01100 [Burkholderiaceae bacterium]|nr:MAG: hypothetical protein E6Q92_01100 [Burkholderiaceae bacterium]
MTPATPRWSAAAYGLMAWPLAWMALPMHLQLGHFLTVTQGLALEEVGLLILLVRALEWIQDLALGLVMERAWLQGWGPGLAWGAAVLLATGFAGLWWWPPASWVPSLAWVGACLLVAQCAHSVLTLLWWRWAHGQPAQVRLRWTSAREAWGLWGLLFALCAPVLGRWLTPDAGELAMHQAQAWWMGALLSLAGVAAWRAGRPRPEAVNTGLEGGEGGDGGPHRMAGRPARPSSRATGLRSLAGPWRDAQGRRLLTLLALQALALALPAHLSMFYFQDQLGWSVEQAGLVLLAYVGVALAGLPWWQGRLAAHGPEKVWKEAAVLSAAALVAAPWLSPATAWAFWPMALLSGFALGADLLCLPLWVARHVELRVASAPAQGAAPPQAAGAYAVMNLLNKGAMALAAGSLPLLAAWGYRPGQGGGLALGLAYAGLPVLLKLAGLAWLARGRPGAAAWMSRSRT